MSNSEQLFRSDGAHELGVLRIDMLDVLEWPDSDEDHGEGIGPLLTWWARFQAMTFMM